VSYFAANGWLTFASWQTIGRFVSPAGGLFTLDCTRDGSLLATAGAGKVLTLLDVVA